VQTFVGAVTLDLMRAERQVSARDERELVGGPLTWARTVTEEEKWALMDDFAVASGLLL